MKNRLDDIIIMVLMALAVGVAVTGWWILSSLGGV